MSGVVSSESDLQMLALASLSRSGTFSCLGTRTPFTSPETGAVDVVVSNI
jgi:hypothetical protein